MSALWVFPSAVSAGEQTLNTVSAARGQGSALAGLTVTCNGLGRWGMLVHVVHRSRGCPYCRPQAAAWLFLWVLD